MSWIVHVYANPLINPSILKSDRILKEDEAFKAMQLGTVDMSIITGNSTMMRELVVEVLEKHKFVYENLISQSVITVLGDKK